MSNEGLAEALPRQGFRALRPEQPDLDDLFELHAHIAGLLAGRAALVADDAHIAAFWSVHEEFERLAKGKLSHATSARMSQLNIDFHRYISRLAPGDRLRWFLRLSTRFVPEDLYEAEPGGSTPHLGTIPSSSGRSQPMTPRARAMRWKSTSLRAVTC